MLLLPADVSSGNLSAGLGTKRSMYRDLSRLNPQCSAFDEEESHMVVVPDSPVTNKKRFDPNLFQYDPSVIEEHEEEANETHEGAVRYDQV